jgi:hypothetical protein
MIAEFETEHSRAFFRKVLVPSITARYPLIGIDVCRLIHEYSLFDPALHTPEYAASTGRLELLKFIVRSGEDVADGQALVAACKNGQVPVVRYLLHDWGVLPFVLDDEAIFTAARARHLDVIAVLVEYGADAFGRDEELLSEVVAKGDFELLLRLVDHEEDFMFEDLDTVFKLAVVHRHMDIIQYLHARGGDPANIGLRNAAARGYLDILQYLVENGGDIHSDNNMALIVACENERLDVVRYLLQQGADPAADAFAAVRQRMQTRLSPGLRQVLR